MVPSRIDSPIWGMITSVGMKVFSALRDASRIINVAVCRPPSWESVARA
jgi:hypothetical protein